LPSSSSRTSHKAPACESSCPEDRHSDNGSCHGKYAYCLKGKGHRVLFNVIAGGTKDLGAFGLCTWRFNLKQVRDYSRNDRNSRVTYLFSLPPLKIPDSNMKE
jgi:hypothetical protein